jgi:hypothetical protein
MWKLVAGLSLVLATAAHADDTAAALVAWDAACPQLAADGSCVADVQPKGRVCAPADARVVLHATPRAKEALAKLQAVHPSGAADRARVALALADASFEAFASLAALPAGLDFDPARRDVRRQSQKRLDTWMLNERGVANDVIAQYRAVIAIGDPASEVAALERIARVEEAITGVLLGAPIPPTNDPDVADAYCDRLVGTAQLDRVVAAYAACLTRAVATQQFDGAGRACEQAHGFYDPMRYPPASERRAEPTAPPITDVEN